MFTFTKREKRKTVNVKIKDYAYRVIFLNRLLLFCSLDVSYLGSAIALMEVLETGLI